MAELVSPCCGAEYSDDEIPRSNCCGALKAGDSDICPNIECLEHADFPEYLCSNCDEWFEEPEIDYEYDARRRENAAEWAEDERRDMGL